jgi:hypothetical protein
MHVQTTPCAVHNKSPSENSDKVNVTDVPWSFTEDTAPRSAQFRLGGTVALPNCSRPGSCFLRFNFS